MSPLDGSLRVAATGAVTPEHAWARYTEPRRWPSWAPHLREVDYPHEVVQQGTSGRVTGVAGVVALFTVESVDHDARRWSWQVRSGGVHVRFEHGVDPAEDGCEAWLVGHALWPVLLAYAPLARWALGRLVSP
ncbi:SRPBCC family protein [Phycicoccus sp. CSK15P-2]|uniref:SRPBCC family protein n=1 Tax=Phycicoccus sp. CSK15P-2 TaxID=2807627 RepID=UPI00195191EC|nr:SRPBCC family protein [Phycicoccus sp. CSK15P-2]MBM6405300.1 SRPBCC family protein [Phycicoccus sp. CSK15P-2]